MYGESFEQMLKNLQILFGCLAKAGLKLKPTKMYFYLRRKMRYLGHVVSQSSVSTDPDKISAVQKLAGASQREGSAPPFLGCVDITADLYKDSQLSQNANTV